MTTSANPAPSAASDAAAFDRRRAPHRAGPETPSDAAPSGRSSRPPRRRAVRRRLAAAAAALVLHAVPAPDAAAQAGATTGVIRGVVRDPLGQPAPGAVIVILHRETDLQTIVETTPAGAFVRSLLPPGTYDLTVTADGGYGVERIEGAALRVGETLDLAVALRVVAAETVTVAADGARLVSTADVTSSQRVADEVVDRLPSNGRNYLDLALLTPGASISQGPDGDVLNISGQRGIFNNVIVDGADFNNPFFGEQRGGQRPAFTFNQDAIEEIVVVNQGATAEFGRSAGGFVNVITKSGTNDASGSAHYYGQWDEISAAYSRGRGGGEPDFGRSQFGGTLGGPLVQDRAFYFLAYDQQAAAETRQTARQVGNPAALGALESFLQSRWPGLFDDEFGPIRRTDDARSFLAKVDFAFDARHQFTAKYNHTWSEQVNGTFDVDAWGRSANGIERDRSHAVNTGLRSLLGNTLSNEFRLQWAREDRPRWYDGPLMPGAPRPGQPQFDRLGGRPFPDVGMDFADGFRIGLPFFLPIDPSYDTRLQALDNVSVLLGRHLVKAGVEYNRTRAAQQFIGFANSRYLFDSVDGFVNFVTRGHRYVTCSDGSSSDAGVCPAGTEITGPVLFYLQAATVPGIPADRLGRQELGTDELGIFVQDTWTPHDRLTLDFGLRWEGTWHPDVFVAPEETFFAPYLDDPRFPSDGRIPDDLDNFQPRLGLAWDAGGDGRTVVRANAGSYVARIPLLVFAGHRTTNGAFQQLIFRSSAASPALGPVPPLDRQLDGSETRPFLPDVQVADRDLELPRTWSFSAAVDRDLGRGLAASATVTHARTDNLFRFVNRNDPALGAPFGVGTHPTGGGLGALTVAESSARSRYLGVTLGLRGRNAFGGRLTFETNYTLAFDRSDDDNERDPFVFRYASAADLAPEYGWSDRDRRHGANGYVLLTLPGGVRFDNAFQYLSASPVSARCGTPDARAAQPPDRICADGSILQRNTLRRENEFFTWDVRLARRFGPAGGASVEPVFEMFNVLNADNLLDTAQGSLLFNFDGTIRSGLGDTRRAQIGVNVRF